MDLRILLADDHEIIRQGVRGIIEKQPGWTVCGEASTGREAVALVEKLQPDIVVMDMTMPELNGLEATRQIKRRWPEVEVLIFTGIETEDLIHQVFEAGARSYIVKTDAQKVLVTALQSLAQHKPFFTSYVGEVIFAKYLNGKAASETKPESNKLTEREREIIQLLAEGKSNKEVATMLGISVKTAETHRAAIMRKLDLPTFSDLVRYAIRNQIIRA
jgi:DNA-binding NarL/FixJ family response regulator